MDARIHQFGTPLAIALVIAGVGVGARDYLIKAESPTISRQPIIPKSGEFTPVTLKDGSSVALVKAWSREGGLELFNPTVPPSADIRIVREAIRTGKYSAFVFHLADSSGAPVWGWLFQLNKCPTNTPIPCDSNPKDFNNFQFVPITQETVRANPEIFKALTPK